MRNMGGMPRGAKRLFHRVLHPIAERLLSAIFDVAQDEREDLLSLDVFPVMLRLLKYAELYPR